MAAFIAVAGVNTCADQTVADVKACPQGGFHIRAVIGVNIYGIVSTGLFGSVDELAYNFVAVRTTGIFAADGYLTLGTFKTVAYATHIHGNGFRHTGRYRTGATVTDFFINGDLNIGLSL